MAELKKYALVTGASSGIGWHISMELAARGYSIIGVSNQPGKLAELKSLVQQNYESDCLTLDVDLAEPGAANAVYNFCLAQNIAPEVLVNNAGVLLMGELISREQSKLEQILYLHINTLSELCYLFAKQMKTEGCGYILNVSSISAVMPFPVISVYGPSKAYVRAFTRGLRVELAEYNINVCCLIPGATDTPLNESLSKNAESMFKPAIMMKPETVAKRAVRGLFKNRVEIVPGILNKVTLVIIPLIPTWLVRKLYQSRLGRKLK